MKYKNKRITISAESLPVLKKTVIPDWKDHVMQGIYDQRAMNISDMVYRFPSGSIFQFLPSDDMSRWHGLRSHVVYFDELYYIKKDIFLQAAIRTSERIFVSFNPVSRFWIDDYWDDKDTAILHSTYKSNPYLSQNIIDALEYRISKDSNFRRVYLEGKFGQLTGLIFTEGTHWYVTDEWPDDFKQEVLGCDFGYSVDPAAIVHVRYHNGEIYVKERLYAREQLNSDLANYLDIETVADSAEPKSIAELRRLGKDVKASVKGADSINSGIQLIKQFKVNVHHESTNLIKELRNYTWQENRQGETLTKPIDDWNHGIDALRYGVSHLFQKRRSWVSI